MGKAKLARLVGVILLCSPALVHSFEVCWQNPSENVDGSPLTDLAHVDVYWGTVQGTYPNSLQYDTTTPGAQNICTTVDPGAPGDYYVVATATNTQDEESAHSNTVLKNEPNTTPLPPIILATPQAVYTVIKQPDRFVLLPIGTVPAGTACDPNNSVNGRGAVPNAEVIWTNPDGPRPIVVVAECTGG